MRIRNKVWNRKGLAEVIAATMLLLVLAGVSVVIYNWAIGQTTSQTSKYVVVQKSQVSIDFFDPNTLYIRSSSVLDFNYSNIKIDGVSCDIEGVVRAKNLTVVDLDFCTKEMKSGPKEIVLFSSSGIFVEMKYLYSTIVGDFMVKYDLSGACDPSYAKVFSVEYISDSHAELATSGLYTYAVCVKHRNYTLTTACSGVYDTLFYLDDQINAHVFVDNESSYLPVDPWYELCLGGLGGSSTMDVQVTDTDLAASEYSCIASVEVDDVYGGHMGNCNAYPDKIWAKLD